MFAFSGTGIKYKELINDTLKELNNEYIEENILFLENINQDVRKVLEGVEDKLKYDNNLKDGRKVTPNYLKSSNAERNIK